MKAFALALLVGALCFSRMSHASADAADLVLLEVSELDAEDTAHLRELLDRPLRVVRLSDARADAVTTARALGVADVLILDRAHGRVSLVHAGASAVYTRTTGSRAISSSAYAVSFVAAELLTLSAQLDAERARHRALRRAWLRAGTDVNWGGAPYAGTWRPEFAVGGMWARPTRGLGLALELVGALAGQTTEASEFGQLRLTRQDLDARGGFAYQKGRLALLGLGQLGLAIQRARYTGPGGRSSRHFGATAGAGIQVQVSLMTWLSMYAEGFAGAPLRRADFVVQGTSVARESAWLGRAGVGLALALPVR